ncbi:UNC93-like protein 1, partial [Rutidosis leptorrhynchoides]|uniref:UNC93-like protein 1 n=1 Tax=Rutidosis leptorrhynchoides TaxID=125765 RepID=UPI003A98F628
MTSYPPANRKGTYISIFWSIFNMGGVTGGLIPFILNYNRTEAVCVNDGTYIAYMCFMSAGTVISLGILPPDKVVRDDGSRCTRIKYPSAPTEAMEILKLFTNWKMLLIFPAAWASNFFYSYLFNNVNGVIFNMRTRGLNNVFYFGAQMIGSIGIGYVLDFSFKSRRMRGFVGIGVVALLGTGIWVGGLASQLTYSRDNIPEVKLDFKDSWSDFAGPFVLYFSYGLLDAMFQSMVYWVIGALADDSEILSRYSGFYRGVQSAGAAVAWQVDTRKVSFLSQLIVSWSLITISYPMLMLLVYLAVKDDKEPSGDDKQVSLPLPKENFPIIEDHWLPNHNFSPGIVDTLRSRSIGWVSQIIDHVNGCWNSARIFSLFIRELALQILRVPISLSQPDLLPGRGQRTTFSQNKARADGICTLPSASLIAARRFQADFLQATAFVQEVSTIHPQRTNRWLPPNQGAIIRDSSGNTLVCQSSFQPGFPDIAFAEASALLMEITLASSHGITQAIFESDSLMVVNDINSNSLSFLICRELICSIKQFATNFLSCHFVYVPRGYLLGVNNPYLLALMIPQVYFREDARRHEICSRASLKSSEQILDDIYKGRDYKVFSTI